MKRAPLKRGTSKLKRTAIKPRAKRHRDTAASLAIREQYRLDNPKCELSPLFRKLGIPHGDDRGVEIHHICGGNFGRLDLVSNLITLCPSIHRWVEDHVWHGRTACLIVKHSKGEVNAGEFRRCSGQLLRGWLENHPPGAFDGLQVGWRKLIDSLPKEIE